MIKAVLFDFDGVLTTDETGSLTICKYLSTKTGLDCESLLSAYRKYNSDLLYGKRTHADIWDCFCRRVGFPIGMDMLYESFTSTPIDHAMEDLAQKLKRGGYKIGMVTDNKADRIKSVLAYHGWDGLFDVVALSAKVGSGKENEAIFLEALSGLQLKARECVFIDNKRENLAVPARMGMTTLFFDDQKRDVPFLTQALRELGIGV